MKGTPIVWIHDSVVLFTVISQLESADALYRGADGDPYFLIKIMCLLLLLIGGILVITFWYHRWKKYNNFIAEMKALDLNPEEEGTLAAMVKRHSMSEPVNILFSARLFDEMASDEILRVLGSPASAVSKQKFIDQVYNIRTRTYHPEWDGVQASNKTTPKNSLSVQKS